MTRIFSALVLATMAWVSAALAQDIVPDHRYVYSRDVDFYGADLTPLFDTTQSACTNACDANGACVAFTYNSRSNACFPKSAVTDRTPYAGAFSAERVATDPAVLAQQAQRVEDLKFLGQNDLEAARDLAEGFPIRFAVNGRTADQMLTASAEAFAQNNRVTGMRWLGAALALTDRGDLWENWAYHALRLGTSDPSDFRRQSRLEALPATINAYLRADGAGARAAALQGMAEALEALERGRDMIPALRLAYDIQPRDDIDAALEDAIGKYGFRVVDHRVDNDAASPRICAEFSEDLAASGVDYEPFARTAAAGVVVQAEDRQLCLDGVQHGARYEVTFRSGLPAASGETLARDVTLNIYVRDRAPLVRFPGRSYVLPRSADAALPIETVNMPQVDLALRRVSDRNLLRAIQESYFGTPMSYYADRQFADEIAQEVWTGTAEVQNDLNVDTTTRLPLGDALAGQPTGIYVLTARQPDVEGYDAATASQWFVLTDLGLSTWQGIDGLTVSTRSLGTAEAQPGVTLTLISRANVVLGQATSGADGFASFDAGLVRGTGGSAPALLVAQIGAADDPEDMAFLPLTDPAFDLSDRGVEGRPPAPPIDTFMATDRGAYRVGDVINVTALTRDGRAEAIAGLPLTAILTRPDGVEYSRTLSTDPRAGGHVFNLPLGMDVPRGAWRLDLKSDLEAAPLATQTVLVEDFLPERIDFDLSLPDAPLRLTDTPPLKIDARYLFGAAGANLAVEGEVRLLRRDGLDDWPGYSFGRHDTQFSPRTRYLDPARTGADGTLTLPLVLPDVDPEGQLLEARVTVRVSEGSGRPVEREVTAPIAPQGAMIGINPAFDDVLPEMSTARFDLIATEGTLPVKWTVNRVETQYQWYQLYGNWNWEPTTRRIRVASGSATLGQVPVTVEAATEWGEYELVVETSGAPYIASSANFYSGWYGAGEGSDAPDRLEMSLNADSFAVGDTAQLRLVPGYDGTALITVASNRVIDRRVVAVTAGENIVPLTVGADWGTGAYVTASVIRPMDVQAGQNPARALGVAHAAVAPGDRQLAVSVSAPDAVDGQKGSFDATVRVEGVAAGETAFVTLAAVDVGILNLTGYQAPDPSGHYFGQRRLGVEMRDVYGRLIDGMNGALGTVRSGGDAAGLEGLQSPPPTEELMSWFTGPVTLGADGTATVSIPRPAFNGTIRLMAVAWSPTSVGQAQADVLARDPVVVTASLPKFLAPGDSSRLLLDVVHADGPGGTVQLALASDGLELGTAPASFDLAEGASQRITVPFSAARAGDYTVTVTLTTPAGKELAKTLALGVRVTDPEVATTRRFSLGAGEVFTFDDNVLAGLKPGAARATLAAGPLARFDVPGLLMQLDRYPYGCTEQVTSAALPLLYLSDFAPAARITDLPERIDGAIRRVLARQTSNGAFGLWRAQSGDFWLDVYVTDFLTQARDKGFAVPDLAYDLAMDNLKNRVNYAADFDEGGEDIAYALLVLARNGSASMGDLRYYADTKGDDFGTPLATAQLGAALAMYGDQLRADGLFATASAQMANDAEEPTRFRADFGTPLRDAAGVLKLAALSGSNAIDRSAVATRIGNTSRSLSTQEAAQVLMASQALSADTANPGLTVDDQPASGPVIETMEPGGEPHSIRNVSGVPTDVTLTTYGVPVVASDAGGYGYAIERAYYTMKGEAVDGPFAAGERRVVVLTIQPFEDVGARLIVDDALPAGLEIDNPNLLRAGDIGALEWLQVPETETVQFRAERFVAAVDHRGDEPFQLAYVVRAISPGDYHHPAALVQDMYRPEYRAVTATGRMTVTP
ncbi:alpha-2-macroglobulin family protein [Pseudosulfitobacter koreensis]|uniref:Alpha-2-macroglobulin family protein n=1 Tax=Pseudosulfitobacter koreensis TaxID=2968472 RepID=A0ABT1YWS4_9RHOB|nr:alpha-2-macroglobulin family protein [Pseudosulfitobacter koreense]MCR8825333.1 alpha-2-macroglobulin family protein [Pseudosulfitobacter koreense]